MFGTKGTDPEGGLFLGSVANFVIHKSQIPVLIVK
ncbi:MAG: universal stress protein [Nitrosopumilus sp.]